MLATVTNLTAYRMATRPAVTKSMDWHRTTESILLSNALIVDANIRALLAVNFALQRSMIRTIWGH
ncbi:hypothetical protein J5J83_19695 [Azoarcus sp. L1K30]|uniref:hypothetical protein n=1 Tax=Azoarcus sp. L1K30 TaxID=2820277 RepID=UPI001B821AE7|nr:hypothetical protein [Azoarcus sp. L1K30]MBR0568351.1 hypothetical protein [Azoarcus sp. L1K30]